MFTLRQIFGTGRVSRKQHEAIKINCVMVTSTSEYPDAWLMPENVKDLKALNKMKSNVPATQEDLSELGISYWKVCADAFGYYAVHGTGTVVIPF